MHNSLPLQEVFCQHCSKVIGRNGTPLFFGTYSYFSADISTLFVVLRGDGLVAGASATIGDSATLRRATQVVKAFNNPLALKRKSYPAMVKVHMVTIYYILVLHKNVTPSQLCIRACHH
jgi:hypothetical protein